MRVPAYLTVTVLVLTCALSACCTSAKNTSEALPPEGPAVETAGWETHPAAPWNQGEAAAARPLVVTGEGTRPLAPAGGSDLEAMLAANRRLNEQVSRLMAEVQSMKKPVEPAPSTDAAAAAPAGAGDLAAVRGVLARSGASDLDTGLTPEGNVAITLPGSLCFASGKAELQAAAQKKLGAVLVNLSKQFPGLRLRVEGHTDSDPIRRSKWESNQALSEARASSVAGFVVQSGAFGPEQVSSAGYGSSRPVASNDTAAGKAENRRVEIVLLR